MTAVPPHMTGRPRAHPLPKPPLDQVSLGYMTVHLGSTHGKRQAMALGVHRFFPWSWTCWLGNRQPLCSSLAPAPMGGVCSQPHLFAWFPLVGAARAGWRLRWGGSSASPCIVHNSGYKGLLSIGDSEPGSLRSEAVACKSGWKVGEIRVWRVS